MLFKPPSLSSADDALVASQRSFWSAVKAVQLEVDGLEAQPPEAVPGMGHNNPPKSAKPDFKAVLAENMRGLYRAQRDTLVRAIRDPLLGYRHCIVLAEIIMRANFQTGVAYPGYKGIAEATGYSESTVELTVTQLLGWGYLASTRKAAEPGGRALAHYTVIKPTVEQLQAAITAHMMAQRGKADPNTTVRNTDHSTTVRNSGSVPNTPHPKKGSVPNSGVRQYLEEEELEERGADAPETSPSTIRNLAEAEPKPCLLAASSSALPGRPNGAGSSCGDSGQMAAPVARPAKVKAAADRRGTRLPADWVLPDGWRDWALAEFNVSAVQVQRAADKFRDHWHGVPPAQQSSWKSDWFATWRNWCRREKTFAPRTHSVTPGGQAAVLPPDRCRQILELYPVKHIKTFFETAEPIDDRIGLLTRGDELRGRLVDLPVNATTIINAGDYGFTIRDLAIRRELIVIGGDVVNAAYDAPVDFPPKEQIEEAETRLFALIDRGERGRESEFSAAADAAMKSVRDAHLGKSRGLPTGLKDLDAKVGGLQPDGSHHRRGTAGDGEIGPHDNDCRQRRGHGCSGWFLLAGDVEGAGGDADHLRTRWSVGRARHAWSVQR